MKSHILMSLTLCTSFIHLLWITKPYFKEEDFFKWLKFWSGYLPFTSSKLQLNIGLNILKLPVCNTQYSHEKTHIGLCYKKLRNHTNANFFIHRSHKSLFLIKLTLKEIVHLCADENTAFNWWNMVISENLYKNYSQNWKSRKVTEITEQMKQFFYQMSERLLPVIKPSVLWTLNIFKICFKILF